MVSAPLNDIAVLLILTILHVVAILYSWRIGRVFNSRSWLFIVGGFAFLFLRRVIAFLVIFEFSTYNGAIMLIDRFYIPIVFWALILIGSMRIFYKIRTSINIESRVKRATTASRRKRR